MDTYTTRRGFLRALPAAGAALGLALAARPAWGEGVEGGPCHAGAAGRARAAHPDPRPGVDASRVTPREKLGAYPDAVSAFDHVREMPEICDGIACRCGCHEDPSMRSLLSCFEGDGMASHCSICQGQAETAYRLFRQRKSLAQIRAALDEAYG